jgi:hypothetical protein
MYGQKRTVSLILKQEWTVCYVCATQQPAMLTHCIDFPCLRPWKNTRCFEEASSYDCLLKQWSDMFERVHRKAFLVMWTTHFLESKISCKHLRNFSRMRFPFKICSCCLVLVLGDRALGCIGLMLSLRAGEEVFPPPLLRFVNGSERCGFNPARVLWLIFKRLPWS